jgi:hypothetical protein
VFSGIVIGLIGDVQNQLWGQELLKDFERTAVLIQFMYLNTRCPLKAVLARKIIVVSRP